MAKVKCEYCGNYIEDTLENCDVCGAVNDNHQRVTNDTPKTIEELQSWYIARNLPPEETTRFFIGKDIKKPRAFGIYKDGSNFIVYKNKANGQRAIRYKGTDEAYAVNELYMRLKEEILNQKSTNLKKKEQSRVGGNCIGYANVNYASRNKKKSSHKLLWSLTFAPIAITVVLMFAMIGSLFFDFSNFLSNFRNSEYYLSESNDVYYLEENKGVNDYVWWLFDKETKAWSKFATYEDKQYPYGVTEDDYNANLWQLAESIGVEGNDLDVYNSRTFIDSGNHKTPSTSYYWHNDTLYYFLNDTHGSYGTDNTGWYVYENDGWQYYCDEDDKETLGEDLWYSDREYSKGSTYIYDFTGNSWSANTSSFEDTAWYKSYESNNRAYEKRQEEIRNDNDNNSWDNDSDYDWDSGSSWDSGSTDWNSDW